MPTPTAGLYEISLTGDYYGIDFANVFHYWNVSNIPINNFANVATEFNDNIAAQLTLFTNTNVNYREIVIRDVLGLANDFVSVPTVGTGAQPGEGAPSFAAMAFRLGVSTKETKKGAKRFVGIAEANKDGNTVTAGLFGLMQAFEPNLLQALNDAGVFYSPVIYGKATPSQPLRSVVNLITSATALQTVTSQVSRK